MFFDTPPHDPAPRHNEGLSYGASYGVCGAKLLHRKPTKYLSRALARCYCRFVDLSRISYAPQIPKLGQLWGFHCAAVHRYMVARKNRG
jgi:hypothetical protein